MHATINPTTGAYGALVVDTNDLIMQSSFEYPPETVLRVKRSLNTGEPDDVAIVVSLSTTFYFLRLLENILYLQHI